LCSSSSTRAISFWLAARKRQPGVPLAGHQRLANEDLARRVRIDGAEIHAPPAVDHDAVQRGPLQRRDLGGLLLPVRIQQLLLQQVATHLLQPLRFDGGDAAAEQPRRLHQFGRHDPAPRFLGQVRTGMAVELDPPRTQIDLFLLHLPADVAQQAGQHGQVQLLVTGGSGVELPFVLGHHRMQLGVDVAPFAQSAHADEVLAQHVVVLPVAELVRRVRSRRWHRSALPRQRLARRSHGLRGALGHGQHGL
jgi:hypothetical protein